MLSLRRTPYSFMPSSAFFLVMDSNATLSNSPSGNIFINSRRIACRLERMWSSKTAKCERFNCKIHSLRCSRCRYTLKEDVFRDHFRNWRHVCGELVYRCRFEIRILPWQIKFCVETLLLVPTTTLFRRRNCEAVLTFLRLVGSRGYGSGFLPCLIIVTIFALICGYMALPNFSRITMKNYWQNEERISRGS
ncbi:hypothetical protein DL96DRAFT_1000186 [Flagelloscypha sp. PMI_526]|nr:hypothetical protein DL96DRAFT_1000186 [Flagelloscypha sp. PMI_526]